MGLQSYPINIPTAVISNHFPPENTISDNGILKLLAAIYKIIIEISCHKIVSEHF